MRQKRSTIRQFPTAFEMTEGENWKMRSSLGSGTEKTMPQGAGRPPVLPSIECDYCAPVWEDGIRPDLARCVLVIYEPADNTAASVAILGPEPRQRRGSGILKRVDPKATILLKSQSKVDTGQGETPSKCPPPSVPVEVEDEVDKLVKDYAHLRYFPPRQNELAFEFEVLVDGTTSGRIKGIAKRWSGGSGVRYPVRIGPWLEALRENIAQRATRRVC